LYFRPGVIERFDAMRGNGSKQSSPTKAVAAGGADFVRLDLTARRPLDATLHRYPRATAMQADMHMALELGIVCSGRMARNHGHGWVRLSAGDAWACASWQPHWWRSCEASTAVLVFVFNPELLAELPRFEGFDLAAAFRTASARRRAVRNRQARQRLSRLASRFSKHKLLKDQAALGFAALIEALAIVSVDQGPGKPSAKSPRWRKNPLDRASRIGPALELVERTVGRPVKVAEAAREASMGRSAFAALFKELTGLSFSRFALRSRLARAAREIRSSESALKTIAYKHGFTDASHFHRAFLAHYGMTPGRYKRG